MNTPETATNLPSHKIAFSIATVADALDVSTDTIKRLIYRKELASYKIGGRRLIKASALDDYLKSIEEA